jgi:hypothetical protein
MNSLLLNLHSQQCAVTVLIRKAWSGYELVHYIQDKRANCYSCRRWVYVHAPVVPKHPILMDRGFPGFRLFDHIIRSGANFLVRLPLHGLFGPVRTFLDKGRGDGIVTIHPSQPIIKEYHRAGLPPPGKSPGLGAKNGQTDLFPESSNGRPAWGP